METIVKASLFVTIISTIPLLHSGNANYAVSLNTSVEEKLCFQRLRERIAYCDERNLENVPKYLNHDVLLLDLEGNVINNLYNSSFSKYSLLERLYLEYNDIRYIENGTFYPLKHLRSLLYERTIEIYIYLIVLYLGGQLSCLS